MRLIIRMKMTDKFAAIAAVAAVGCMVVNPALAGDAGMRKISVEDYCDRMQAAWIGQMVGVARGFPTEYKYTWQLVPTNAVPEWTPKMINDAFWQDDIYVELNFIETMNMYGYDVDIRQAGIDFANTTFPLFHANWRGRTNLRAGIAPPDCSHPYFNPCSDDIDYQIDADYSGILSPGLPQSAIYLGEKFGRLMNYGDGMYAGQFIGAMYAEAFFEKDPVKIVRKALKAIPSGSQYAQMVRDVLKWHEEVPDDYETAWKKIVYKYCPLNGPFCEEQGWPVLITAVSNGAMTLLGVLWGERDLDKTVVYSMRGGFDSDCNPSSAAGVIATTYGLKALPKDWTSGLSATNEFINCKGYTFAHLASVCEKLARESVVKNGGRIEKVADGREYFLVPDIDPTPSELVSREKPGPLAGRTLFTKEELPKILYQPYCGLGGQMGTKSVKK